MLVVTCDGHKSEQNGEWLCFRRVDTQALRATSDSSCHPRVWPIVVFVIVLWCTTIACRSLCAFEEVWERQALSPD